jgi:hypothetical protein
MIRTYPNEPEKHSDSNIEAGIRFVKHFDCLDCDSYEEAKEKVLISMNMITKEVMNAPTEYERQRIMQQRYKNL